MNVRPKSRTWASNADLVEGVGFFSIMWGLFPLSQIVESSWKDSRYRLAGIVSQNKVDCDATFTTRTRKLVLFVSLNALFEILTSSRVEQPNISCLNGSAG